MRKIFTLSILVVVLISIIGFIYINYNSDIEAVNSLNVNLNKLYLEDINIEFFKLNFDVEINNPSDREIVDLSTDFEIFIEDNYIGEGNFSNFNIPSNSNITKDIIISVYYDGLADAAKDVIINIINEGKFNIKIKGTLYAKALFGLSIMEQNYTAIKTYQ